MLFNLAFTGLYLASGESAFPGATGSLRHRAAILFFFSVQTCTTVGYGHITPEGLTANMLTGAEAFLGLLGFAVTASLLFARVSRPNARIIFSDNAVIAPYGGGTAFMLRLANGRSNQLVQVEVRVLLSMARHEGTKRFRVFHELPLERQQVVFFPLTWTVVHPIDPSSPFHGLTQEGFLASDPEVLVLVTAFDEIFSQTVHARTSYKNDEIIWGARFVDPFRRDDDGSLAVDLRKLHDLDEAALP